MSRDRLRQLAVWCLVLVLLTPGAAAASRDLPAEGSLQLVESSSQGVVLALDLTPPILTTANHNGVTYTVVSLGQEYGTTAEPGRPQLPYRSVLVALPPGASAVLTVGNEEWGTLSTAQPVLPAPHFDVVDTNLDVTNASVVPTVVADPAVYGSNQWLPDGAIRLGETARLRDYTVVPLELTPVRYNPALGQLTWLEHAEITITFEGGQLPPAARPDPYFAESLATSILNFETARDWGVAAPAPDLPAAPESGDIKIAVRETGIYKVTYENLINLGLDPGELTIANFALSNRDNPVAFAAADSNRNGLLDAGEYIFFYGQALDFTYYTLDNIYWLKLYAASPGPLMSARRVSPGLATTAPYYLTTRHIQDQFMFRWSQHMQPNNAWWWDQWQSNGPSDERTYPFTLPHAAAISVPVTLTVRLGARYSWTEYNPDHHNRLYLNGSPTAFVDEFWDGRVLRDFTGTVNQSSLISGTNQLRVQTINSDVGRPPNLLVDWTYFKSIEATYYRNYVADNQALAFSKEVPGTWRFALQGFSSPGVVVLDVSNPLLPVQLTGGTLSGNTFTIQETTTPDKRYFAAASSVLKAPHGLSVYIAAPINLRDPSLRVDYLVVSHPNFMSAVQPLVDHRASQGYETLMANIDWVYDQFNAGIVDPVAIRNLTTYAYTTWSAPAPAFLLLVGGGTFNPHGYNPSLYGPMQPTYIPTYYYPIDPYQGESADDNYFVAVSGSDSLPDIFGGRFPITSASAVTTIVNKIINYEMNPERGAWQNDTLVVADDPDSAGNFHATAEAIVNQYFNGGDWDVRKVYYHPTMVNPQDPYYGTLETSRTAIRNKWSQGVSIAQYIGHAFLDYWGSQTWDQFWHNNDTPSLVNGMRLPYLISLDCLDGYFDYPNRPSMAEKFLIHGDGGVIAHFAPSGLGIATGHDYLHRGFLQSLLINDRRIAGEAVVAAKVHLHTAIPNYYQDLLHTFNLFGDPATVLVPLCRTTDINCDSQVSVIDVQLVAGRFGLASGQPGFAKRYDVNNDGSVNVLDIITTASDYGWQP